jgi:hypothetical protein
MAADRFDIDVFISMTPSSTGGGARGGSPLLDAERPFGNGRSCPRVTSESRRGTSRERT